MPLGICYLRQKQAHVRSFLVYWHIRREASASLLVLLYRAIPEPLLVERATGKDLALFCSIIANEEVPEAGSSL